VILAIDQGTTGTTCIVFDEGGRPAGRAYREFTQHFPRPGWVEHDAAEIWDVTRAVAGEALERAGNPSLAGIGITNQRETVVAWDRDTGEPLHRAIVWQDQRTAARCDELKEAGHEPLVRERTGLVLDPYFSGTKIEWLLKEGGVPAGAAFGTIDSWLVFKLTGEHVTDFSNASRTLLFDIGRREWDGELCELLGVEPGSLPEPRPSAEVYGHTERGVPVAGIAGDQQAALYGQACHEPGLGKNTYGTGSSCSRTPAATRPSRPRACSTRSPGAWTSSGLRARGGHLRHRRRRAVAARRPRIIRTADETEELARSLESNDGVYLVPAFTGLGSPHWDPYARGTIVGLTRGSGRAHLARAALEAMAYQTVDAVRAMEESSGVVLEELKAYLAGGRHRNVVRGGRALDVAPGGAV
jgi:glycerol kinase